MTSTTSSKNKFIATFKNIFMRNIGGFVFLQLFSVGMTSFVANRSYPSGFFYNSIEIKSPIDITDDFTFFIASALLVASTIVSFFVVMNSYREILTRRASDFCFAMPVKRETYFNAGYFSSLISIITCYALSISVGLLLLKTNLFFEIKNIIFDETRFFKVMLISLAVAIFALSIFAFCAVLSGRIIHYILFCVVVFVVFMLGASSVIEYLNNMISGLQIDMGIGDMLSPIGSFILISNIIKGDDIKILIISLTLAVLYYLFGLIAFKKRQVESAEFSPSGKIIPAILLVLTQISVFMFNLSLDYTSDLVRGLLGILLVFVVTVVCTALFYKKAFTKTTLISFVVSIVLSISFVLCVRFIPNINYVKYVPEVDEVESVSIFNDFNQNESAFDEVLNVFWGQITNESKQKDALVIQGENSASVIELHKKMISEDVDKNKIDDIYKIQLQYKLKNGKTVKRSYVVNGSSIIDEYAEVIKTDDVLHQIGVFNDKKEILFVSYEKESEIVDTEPIDYYGYYSQYAELPFISNNFDNLRNSMINDIKNSPSKMVAAKFERFPVLRYDYENTGFFRFYTISDNATNEEREKIKSMTFKEVIECYNRYDMMNNPLYGKIDCYSYFVFADDVNTQRFIDMYFQNN